MEKPRSQAPYDIRMGPGNEANNGVGPEKPFVVQRAKYIRIIWNTSTFQYGGPE